MVLLLRSNWSQQFHASWSWGNRWTLNYHRYKTSIQISSWNLKICYTSGWIHYSQQAGRLGGTCIRLRSSGRGLRWKLLIQDDKCILPISCRYNHFMTKVGHQWIINGYHSNTGYHRISKKPLDKLLSSYMSPVCLGCPWRSSWWHQNPWPFYGAFVGCLAIGSCGGRSLSKQTKVWRPDWVQNTCKQQFFMFETQIKDDWWLYVQSLGCPKNLRCWNEFGGLWQLEIVA